jgi:deazaflavin-dependent oxidoreductase (nitroreductase family)
VNRGLSRIGNRFGVWLYRALGGRLASGRRGVHVLLITIPGRRTGLPRSTCVRFLQTDGRLVVCGTGAGAPRDPDWFQNLRAADTADVQVRAEHFRVRPRELLTEERNTIWQDTVLAQAPEVAAYARKAGRTIPVAVLERL